MTMRTWKIWVVAGVVMITLLTINAGTLLGKARRFGKKQFYTQIVHPGLLNGHATWNYTYDQSAYDQEGRERRLYFFADKSLRPQAYLRMYVSGDDQVTAWEEVSSAVVPAQALERLMSREDKQAGC